MREDLIERLRYEAEISDRPGQMDRLHALADEFAAALEAAREDAERMKRDISDLYKVMPMLPITAETMEAATDWFTRYCIDFYREINAALDAAIDQARGKGEP